VSRAIGWLNATKPPFFVWVNLHDAAAATTAANRLGVSASDAAIGKLIAALTAHKLMDNTLIVVAADHGESLGAHNEQTHGIFLYDETIHVPLLMKMPGNQDAGKRVRGKVGLVDVAPTVLEVAGAPVPAQMQGQSLLRVAKSGSDQPVYARTQFPTRAFGWSTVESWRAS
jgi:arylsulfatase A-like enzyme